MLYNFKLKLAKNSLIRTTGIIFLNVLFYSKNIKAWFEKNIFNPYEINGNEDATYAEMQLENMLKHLDISNKKILEIGPGGSYYLACLMLKKRLAEGSSKKKLCKLSWMSTIIPK